MTTEQLNNIKYITDSLNKFGVTNKNIQAGILATVSKESGFIPKSENLNYSAANIQRVWPNTPAADIPKITNNPESLGNYKYGNKGGNAANEGFKFRGRGFNQITFKDSYKRFGNIIGVDLVSNPDKLNDPKIAADALAAFFSSELKAGDKSGSFSKFGVTDSNKINDTTTATKVAIQINAGRGTSFNNSIVQEGYNKALSVVDDLYATLSSGLATGAAKVGRHLLPVILVLVGVAGVITGILIKK